MPQRQVTAVLGPTNTGKTHLAVERMLAHPSGMIGLPLRLLAREVYDRVRLRTGDHAVALVTGEEKIIPPQPRYWVATVEAMPSDITVSFLAIDEVQLAGDLDRGHVFTDRLLNRRGQDETMLLGAATMRPLIERLIPNVTYISRPRFSKLTYGGQKKLTRLPSRSAVVAFSSDMVYAMAELIRRQRGGAAVILGALSPRTRNAQMELFQSGDVDYVVATDAIGMGLNMDLDHVAFASTRKFDGFGFRQLTPAELGQIAGRAGRYMNDGTFWTTAEADPFDAELVEHLESHRFEPVRVLQWRNRDLSFASLPALKASLSALPPADGLTRAQSSFDVDALETLSRDSDIAALANSREMVELLWQVCQIPDYRNISSAEHATLVARIFRFVGPKNGRIPEDWFMRQLSYCNRTEGDIDTLSQRIAHIRTWTFVANRPEWLADPLYWQGKTREIEDRLSDALHERLTQRFIDRRTSVLMRRLRQKEELMSIVEDDGGVLVEGELVGKLDGFRFIPAASTGSDVKGLKAAWQQAVSKEILARAQSLAAAPDPDFALDREARIVWHGAPVARLQAGASVLQPRIALIADEQLTGPERDAVAERLQKYLTRHIDAVLEPLVKLQAAEDVTGLARGIAFRLVENLGVVAREDVADDVKALSQDDRASLRRYGVKFGAFHVFVPLLLKPAATQLRLTLWALGLEKDGKLDAAQMPAMPGQGLTSVAFDRATPRGFYRTVGFRICGERCVRIDMLERLADTIRDRVFWKPRFAEEARPSGSVEGGGFTIVPDMMSLVGCSGEEFAGILRSLGYRAETRTVTTAPAVPAPDAADQAGGSAPQWTAEPSGWSEEALDAPAPVVNEPAPEATPVAAETAPAESSPEAPGEAAPDASAALASDAPAVPDVPSEITLEVWWPKDTGPFRRRRPEGRSGEGARPARPRRGKGLRVDAAQAQPAAEGGAAAAEAGAQAPEGVQGEARPDQRERRRDLRPDREGERGDRRDQPRFKGKRSKDDTSGERPGRDEQGKHRGRDDHPRGKGREPRRFESSPADSRDEAKRMADSPFAVLTALKEKLARGQ
ncbi:MAG: helicase-related protein [Hyphomicrobiales bacterium]